MLATYLAMPPLVLRVRRTRRRRRRACREAQHYRVTVDDELTAVSSQLVIHRHAIALHSRRAEGHRLVRSVVRVLLTVRVIEVLGFFRT